MWREQDRACGRTSTYPGSGRSANQARAANRHRDGEALRGDRVVPAMAVTSAGMALFFHVVDLTAGGHFAISAHHASAAKSGEAKKPNETHHVLRSRIKQFTCRSREASLRAPGARCLTTHIGTGGMLEEDRRGDFSLKFESAFRTFENAPARDRRAPVSTRDRG